MTDIPEIEPGEGGGGGVAPVAAAAIAATALCLSCATPIAGVYCVTCGQKNDDMRRSSFVLFKDFIKDTFAFDSRMWRTLGLMAAAPGAVPSNYSHGRRSRYTPPVRLFLVVSFLFFLVLGLTHTMFVAFDVEALSPAQIAARKERTSAELKEREEALRAAGAEVEEAIAAAREAIDENGAVVVDGETVACDINVKVRYFVRPEDLTLDAEMARLHGQHRARGESRSQSGPSSDRRGRCDYSGDRGGYRTRIRSRAGGRQHDGRQSDRLQQRRQYMAAADHVSHGPDSRPHHGALPARA